MNSKPKPKPKPKPKKRADHKPLALDSTSFQ